MPHPVQRRDIAERVQWDGMCTIPMRHEAMLRRTLFHHNEHSAVHYHEEILGLVVKQHNVIRRFCGKHCSVK